MSLDLNSFTLKQLQEKFPALPKNLKKQEMVKRIESLLQQQEKVTAQKAKILNIGHDSIKKTCIALRNEIGLEAEDFYVGNSLEEIEQNLCKGSDYRCQVFCSLIQIFDHEKIIAQSLTDKWGFLYLKQLQK